MCSIHFSSVPFATILTICILSILYSGQVYGPVAMHIDVPDKACATMLEKTIPLNKLLGFVVDNDRDAELLGKEFRDRCKLKIDIFTMSNPDLSDVKPYSQQLCQEMNLTGYLSDTFTCPDVVRAFLYIFQRVNCILWGRHTADTKRNINLPLFTSENANKFTLFIHDVSGGRNNNGGEITQYVGE